MSPIPPGSEIVEVPPGPDPPAALTSWALPPDQHPAIVYLARLSPGSRRTMQGALSHLASVLSHRQLDAATLDWSAVRYSHTAALRAYLAQRYAPATANKMLAALRGVLQEAWRLGQMDAEAYHRAIHVGPVRGTSKPTGRALSAPEMRTLFATCAADPTPTGVRDAALIALLYGVGLRRFEVVALSMGDWRPDEETLWVLRGKGRRARLTYPPPGAQAALQSWLSLRGPAPGPLFFPFQHGRFLPRRLSGQAVFSMVVRRAQQAGVEHFSPHDLRRSFISDLLDQGVDLVTVQSLAGHASVQTTARYDRRGEVPRRHAAGLLQVPYVPPLPPA